MSPLIPAAAVAVAGYHGGLSPQALALLSFVTASVGISFLGFPAQKCTDSGDLSPLSRVGVLFTCCAVALLIGYNASLRSTAARTPALPTTAPVAFLEGTVERVSQSGNSTTARVRLEWAGAASPTGDATVSGSARGTASIRVPREATLVAGWRYRFRLAPARAPRRTDAAVVYQASSATALSETTPRAYLLDRVRDRVLRSGGEAAPLLLALLLGEDDLLSPAVLSSFRRSGTLHLLALSGMHLGVLSVAAGAIATRLIGKKSGLVVAVAAACFYVALIGPRPGLVRAALLLAAGAATRLVGRRPALVDLLAATFLTHLLVAPEGAFSLAFGLSYASLAGIAVFSPILLRWGKASVPPAVLGPLAAGAGAQIATLPLVVAAFGAVYPVGIVATAVLGPLVLLFMMVGAVIVVADAAWLYLLVVPLLERLSTLISRLGRAFAKAPGIEFSEPAASRLTPVVIGAAALLLLAGLVLGSYYRYHRVGDSLVRARRQPDKDSFTTL